MKDLSLFNERGSILGLTKHNSKDTYFAFVRQSNF